MAFTKLSLLSLSFLLLSLVSALPSSPNPTRTLAERASAANADDALCTKYAYASVNGYDILNNLWGMDDAHSGDQCTYSFGADTNGGVSFGSIWSWSGNDGAVKSYIYAGRQFRPKLVKDIRSMPTKVKWSYNRRDIRANVAYDLFTHPDPNHHNSNGEYELMIWLSRIGGAAPIGPAVATVSIDGRTWTLHSGKNGSMQVYSFVAVGEVHHWHGDIMHFFRHLRDHYGFPVDKQNLITNQFGTEAFTGDDAHFYVRRFEAEVN